MGQTAVSDNQSSSVTLNELAKKARKLYCNFEFQRRSHTMTEINLNRAQITKTLPLPFTSADLFATNFSYLRIFFSEEFQLPRGAYDWLSCLIMTLTCPFI